MHFQAFLAFVYGYVHNSISVYVMARGCVLKEWNGIFSTPPPFFFFFCFCWLKCGCGGWSLLSGCIAHWRKTWVEVGNRWEIDSRGLYYIVSYLEWVASRPDLPLLHLEDVSLLSPCVDYIGWEVCRHSFLHSSLPFYFFAAFSIFSVSLILVIWIGIILLAYWKF